MIRVLAAPLRRLRRCQKELLADERAVTAIEFGLLGIPFFAVIGAILQTSVIFLASQVLESAVNDAAREIRTGQLQQRSATVETFRTEVCNRLFGLFPDCAGLHVRVTTVTDFQSATPVPPVDPNCRAPCDWTSSERYENPVGGKVVQVQVHYRYPVLLTLGPLGLSNMGDGRRLIGSATVFKTEPFPS
ncbi:TadE/TadG family type IV pilus assembly protein [Devosia rhizoryzae]|uniref:Pilus assembly protein n=1 Tax=Devosia rhizoryzae TaxID=2774137 RepID=A0ABX7C773_9HYPH|nr:TadE/TadG family type IV pilus assembly protein [Devosia rhizoryzae]QQR38577.1 pilus assembly protein [Devosia rhizoryzae]